MPNRKVHATVGAIAGFSSLVFTPPRCQTASLAVPLGRTVGGLLGGCLPDLLEPASTPRHREVCHSASAGSVAGLSLDTIRRLESCCLGQAKRFAAAASREPDPWKQAVLVLASWAAEFIGSFLVGVAVGYASHLVLDLFTPAGLPLI